MTRLHVFVALFAIYFLIAPVSVPWNSQSLVKVHPQHTSPAPQFLYNLTGVWSVDRSLQDAVHLVDGQVHGLETVIRAPGSSVVFYGFAENGWIMRVDVDKDTASEFVYVGGRPVSGAFDADGNMIVADPLKGLLKVHMSTKTVELLCNQAVEPRGDGEAVFRTPVLLADDVVIAEDGSVYFSDATDFAPWPLEGGKYALEGPALAEMIRGEPSGRLLRLAPGAREAEVLSKGIWFANGVALASDESYILIAETVRGRVLKHWLTGPDKGATRVCIAQLPGLPDGVSLRGRRGVNNRFWVAVIKKMDWALGTMISQPILRRVFAWLPAFLVPSDASSAPGIIAEVDGDSCQVLRSLHDASGQHVSGVTSVHEHQPLGESHSHLYLGSLHSGFLPRVTLQEG